MNMKKFLPAILAFVLCLAGCGEKNPVVSIDISGIWKITDITPVSKAAAIGDATVDVYIEFRSDSSFLLYQLLGAGSYRTFSGNWSLDGSTLSGTYSDGSPWGSTYEVSVNGDVLTMQSAGEIYTYTRTGKLPD